MDFKQYKEEALKNPELKKEYDKLEDEYKAISDRILEEYKEAYKELAK